MVCPSCGRELGEAAAGCRYCGTAAETGVHTIDALVPADGPTRPSGDLASLPARPSGQTLAPGQRFSNRYTVIKLLGAGGMGEVYQAWDESLGVPVALKLIRQDSFSDSYEARQLEERFKRELRLARQVTHANVVRIHDLGEVGATKFLTMQFVQGADLSEVLRREGRLPLSRALALAKQIAAGLSAVHAAGVVHRDLKPANVIVDGEDRALLTDFGIARAVDAATLHTMPGSVLGTLEYMAPEQARGEQAGERSDIYAFGLILYELLAGGRPPTGSDGGLPALLARIEHGPPPIGTVAPGIPVDVERIVTRCLQADPKARFGSMTEVLSALEQIGPDGRARLTVSRRLPRAAIAAIAAIVIAVVALGGWWVLGRRGSPAPATPHEPISVLIADFNNTAGDPVFTGSLEQALGVAMEGAPFITAYSRTDAAAVAKKLRQASSLDEASARLVAYSEGIRVVLAGTIASRGSGYQLTVRAVNPATGETANTATADASDKAGVLQAVGRVAESLRRVLGDTTPSDQFKGETFSAGSLEAVREYTLAQSLSTQRRNEEAIRHYEEALRLDPSFGRAYAGWANAAFDLGRRAEAERLWNKALSFMDQMTAREKYRTLGTYYIAVAHNNAKAIENLQALVTRYPADLAGHNNLAIAYLNTLQFSKALTEGQRALELYPKSLKFRGNYALYAMYASDFKTAADAARALIAENAGYVAAYLPLAMEALARGDTTAAADVYRRAAATGNEGTSVSTIGLADIALLEGRSAEAVTILVPAIASDRERKNTTGAAAKTIALAEAYAGLRRTREAVGAIDQALQLSREDSVVVPAARLFAELGQADRAAALRRELGQRLPPQARAYAAMLDAEQAIARGRAVEALQALDAGEKLAPLWLLRFTRGIAYESAGHHAEALADFDACTARIGEATAIFLDDSPTFRYVRQLREWQARTRAALGMKPASAP